MAWTYAPDLDERTPNIILSNSSNVVPNTRGGFVPVKSWSPSSSISSYPDISDFVCGAAYLLRDDGSDRLFAGTPTKLYEANQTVAYAWTDVSRGGNYSGVTQWMFDMYGGRAVAAASVGTLTEIQGSNGGVGTAFSNLTNAPKAHIIVVQDNALYAFDYDSGGGEVYDGWIRSDTGNITAWTTGSGECVSGRFTETPGSITAAIKQGNGVVVFKGRGMWRGQYVGLPEVVRWELITPYVGCCGPLAVVNVNDTIYFADFNGFWKYDGSRPKLLSSNLSSVWRAAFGEDANYNNSLVNIGIDTINNVLMIYTKWPAGSLGGSSTHFPFNYITECWGPECDHDVGQGYTVTATINAPMEKISVIPGGSPAVTPIIADALRFIYSTASKLVSMTQTNFGVASTVLDKTFKMYFPQVGDERGGATLTRIYPAFRSYNYTGTGANSVSRFQVLTSRRPFGLGNLQGGINGVTANYDSTLDYVDLTANGNWFSVNFQHRTQSSSGTNISYDFEWLGIEYEYASSRSKN